MVKLSYRIDQNQFEGVIKRLLCNSIERLSILSLRLKLAEASFLPKSSFTNVCENMPAKESSGKKSIGIPIAPPEKSCKDLKCAWHGQLPVRGRVLRGKVRSAKVHNTIIMEWDYHRFIRKYERYQRQKSRITAHNPPCIRAREGDIVVVAECKPISKTKHFVVVGFGKDFSKGKPSRD